MIEEINKIFKKKADYYEEVIEAFQVFRSGAYGTNLELLKWLDDFCLFTIFSLYDLWILQCDYEKSTKKYQQNYYARQTALLCFELLSDVPQILNENFQKLLLEKISNKDINERAKLIRKKLNQMRNEKESELKNIRDLVAAHRDHDISRQIETINSMDNKKIIQFAFDYMKLIEELGSLFNDVIKYIRIDQENLGIDKFKEKYA
jgi:hypothetical protein